MSTSSWLACFSSVVLASAAAVPAAAQAIAVALEGEGELMVAGGRLDVARGSLLLQADGRMQAYVIDAGVLRRAFAGDWRRSDPHTIRLAVRSVLGGHAARGSGQVQFRLDGSVAELEVRGEAKGRPFSARFQSGTGADRVASAPGATQGRSTPPRGGRLVGEWLWAGNWPIMDVTRRGDGLLTDIQGREYSLGRARLVLRENDEFELLVPVGDSTYEFAGIWDGDLQQDPIHLELREAAGRRIDGTGRAWIRARSWDRDWSFSRVELDGWGDGQEFALYFDAGHPFRDTGPD